METPNNTGSPLTYWDYIATDELFTLQRPLTEAHDEMQFIIVHQTFELWFRLTIYELRATLDALDRQDFSRAAHLVRRVATILRTALNGFNVMVTMTQQGYAEFRDSLNPASGFQSSQFRIIEILLGLERVKSDTDKNAESFYWERAVQAGATFTNFMAKYHDELLATNNEAKDRNLRRAMLRVTEQATGRSGSDAYRYLLDHPDEHPEIHALAEAAQDVQQAMLDFRLNHHKVTVFTVGAHAVGTSDSHTDPAPSCAAYLLGVIRDRTTIFPELENAIG